MMMDHARNGGSRFEEVDGIRSNNARDAACWKVHVQSHEMFSLICHHFWRTSPRFSRTRSMKCFAEFNLLVRGLGRM